jgi:hypothetical protein
VAHLTATVTNAVANTVMASWTDVTGKPVSQGMKEGASGAWTLDVPVPSTSNLDWTATATIRRTTIAASDAAKSPCPPSTG